MAGSEEDKWLPIIAVSLAIISIVYVIYVSLLIFEKCCAKKAPGSNNPYEDLDKK